ncbi:unnamed protein product, partial [Heligmosomoides polygyrus]|uniref:DNA-directed RNA polymerase n=1 Tax=Heligmosomoides polygyrus TaxID=6339 RepID=A0A183GV15_HELPZ
MTTTKRSGESAGVPRHRNSIVSQGVPYHFARYAVKDLLQVEKGDMHWLLFLPMLPYQEAGGMYGINGATASHEAALIAGKLDDVTNSSVDNSLKDLHAVRKQANRRIIGAVSRTTIFIRKRNRLTILHKDKVYLCPGPIIIERDEVGIAFPKFGVHYGEVMRFRILKDTLTICVTRPVTKSTITVVPVFRRADVPINVTSDYDDISRRYLCCLLIKQAPKLILGLIGAAVCGAYAEKKKESRSLASRGLQQPTSKRSTLTIVSRNRSETIISTPLVFLGLPHRTTIKPRLMSNDLRQDHLVSCYAQRSTLLRS